MKLIETLSSKIASSFIGYLHLGSWVDVRVKSLLSGRGVRELDSVEIFWRELFEGAIHHGDRIRFKNAFLTEWIPRTPGSAWRILCGQTSQEFQRFSNKVDRLEGIREGKLLFASESSLEYKDPSPLGVIRLPFGTNPNTYCALCLTTIDAWCCDLGIPVLASASVYDSFVARQQKTNAVEADVEGIVQFRRMPLIDPTLIKALGAKIEEDFLRSILTPLGHPLAYLCLTSPLDVRMRTHNECPPGYLWSISRKWVTHAVTHIIAPPGSSPKPEVTLEAITPEWSYGFLLAHAYVNQPDSIDKCIQAFQLGNISSFIQGEKPSIGLGVGKVEVLTEFDGRAPRFSTAVPLRSMPWSEKQELEKISLALKQLHEGALLEAEVKQNTQQKDSADKE